VFHHAAVLMLADVAVIDEVAWLGEGNSHHDGCNPAASGAPRCHRTVAGGSSVGERDAIHETAGVALRRILRVDEKPGLVHVEVMGLGGYVD
jgi:hypothetical protein